MQPEPAQAAAPQIGVALKSRPQRGARAVRRGASSARHCGLRQRGRQHELRDLRPGVHLQNLGDVHEVLVDGAHPERGVDERGPKRTERHLALTGRALERMTRIAKQCGYLGSDFPLISSHELAHFPPRHALFVATGSQGEPGAMLSKLASDRHPDFEIHADDVFIFSSKTIPGNEEPIERLVNQIEAKGAMVYQAEQFPEMNLQASGHPNQTGLADLYATVHPKLVVPIHGEARHFAANADVAKAAGIHRTMTGGNGDLFSLVEPFRVRRQWGHAGRWAVTQNAKTLEPVTA